MGVLGVINGNLISGVYYDHMGNEYQIPQTMAGVEINVDSDEFQEWYREFTSFRRKQSQKPSTRLIQILTNMSRVEMGRIARNKGSSMVLI